MGKNLLVYIPAITIAVGMIAGYVRLQAQTETTKSSVSELKLQVSDLERESDADVKSLKYQDKDLEKKIEVNKVEQDNIAKKVEEVSLKSDKIYDLLLKMERKL